ncbi:MAG: cyclic nucleotide-binding domain-containing protein [Hyphomicrobiales bacterium]
MLDEKIERLKSVPLFAVLDDIALHHIVFNSHNLTASDGTNLFVEGDAASGAIFLESGELSLLARSKGEMVERVKLQAGAVVDPYALVTSGKRPVTAKAVGDVKYQLLDRSVFRKVLENYPGHAERLQDYLREEINRTVSTLNGVAARLDFIQ